MKIIWITVSLFMFVLIAYGASESKVIYKYRQYEKFDLDEMSLEGETGSPGDLSIIPRFQKKFKNKLPYRTNFNQQIRKSIESIR